MVFDSENNAKMYTPNRTARKCHDVLFVTSIVKRLLNYSERKLEQF